MTNFLSHASSFQHPALQGSQQSQPFAKKCFELTDIEHKGYIVASDVERLRRDVQKIDEWDESQEQEKFVMSTHDSNEMIETTNMIFAANPSGNTAGIETTEDHQRLHPQVFQRIFAQLNSDKSSS